MAIPAVLALGARVGMPVARELIKKYGPGIVDAVAGTGIGAFIGDKLFFGQDVKETPEGIVIGPEEKEPETLEELKKRTVLGFPGEAVPPFKLPGFNEGVTGIDELTKPTGFGEGYKEPTLEDLTSSGGFTLTDMPDMSIMTMANERGSIEANKKRAEQQNKAREIAGQKAKEIFEKNSDKPFYSENPNTESIFDIISRETGYKSKQTIIKMLTEQGVDYTTAIKLGEKPENFKQILEGKKEKKIQEYKDSIRDQVLQIYEANKDLPFNTTKEDVPSIIKIMQESIPSYQKGQKISIPTAKEILIEADVYEHGRSGETRKDVALELSKISKEKLTQFSAMFERGLDTKEFPTIEKLDEFFTSQGIDLTDLNELLSNNPKKFNDLEATRVKAQEILLDLTSDFNIALATQAENYDVNGNFMPIKLAKMHPSETLRPIKDEDQFRSIDIENVRIGGSTVNTVVQPEHGKALARYIKNEDVENTKRIIEVLKEYHILTNLNDMLDEKDYKWLEENKIVEIPKISYKGEEFVNYDAVVFGAKDTPSIEQVIEAELKARKNFGLKYSVFKEMKDKGEKLPAFNTYLKDGGIASINYTTRPLGF